MSARMRQLRREAIDVLTQLAARGPVEIIRVQQHYAILANGSWYDAGTVEGALAQAGHAVLDRAARVSAEVPPLAAPTQRKTA